ncbi:MAG: adenylyl-sulfate kinase [Bacteroidales bacterium]|nr:adenylyl-sulfate kinase [Bacteroidales bacterium]
MTQTSAGKIIWLYGRPCSGKTTLSGSVAEVLKNRGKSVIILDGDDLRNGINSDLGYTLNDRHENIRRVSELAKILAKQDYWVVCSFVTPTRELRELVETINSDMNLSLIFIQASLETCIKRDVKGHYLKAKMHNLTDFTGISSPFEEPVSFENSINTDEISIEEATLRCLDLIMN